VLQPELLLKVITTDIQLSEVFSSAELGYEFGDQWEGVFVLDHHGIEYMVVLNQLE